MRPEGDHTGVRLKLTRAPQPMSAGMLTYAVGFLVPPKKKSHLVPNSCCYSGFQPLTGFAFRVHAHALGRCVTGSTVLWMYKCCSDISVFALTSARCNSELQQPLSGVRLMKQQHLHGAAGVWARRRAAAPGVAGPTGATGLLPCHKGARRRHHHPTTCLL